jgi:outer membrane protein assembly factor BamD
LTGAAGGGTTLGVEVVGAPPAAAAVADPNALVKPVTSANTTLPPAEAPARAPDPVNDIKSAGATATPVADANAKKKAPKADSDESSSKKKKKKGIAKLNPF